ncbi:MAG: methylenetetrahydrofolate reductase [Clostridia bacterium]|nr:methylenetetrahydrofolate reductase [NAD(P)H] [Clostridia bacterium]
MKISEILKQNKQTISFEVFPPKTETAFDSIRFATEEIAGLSPAYMSVTYGAGGGTSKYTLDIAENIEKNYGVPTLAHLTCVSSTRATVLTRIADMKVAGIENVMALRGDIPVDMENMPRDYKYALELVRELRSAGDFCIGGACYPEVHPESKNSEEDIIHLRAKADAGCDFLTTQMFFDNGLYYRFVERARGAGISLPIIPGVMPITRASQVERAINLSGSYMPRRFLSLVERFGDDPVAMTQVGIEYATEQITELYENGVGNVHVYSMNKPEVARAILNNVSDILK